MMCALKDVERQQRVRVRLVCVLDEESEELDERSTDDSWRAASEAISRSPASRPTCISEWRRRACSRCRSRSTDGRPTARPRGWATTPCSRLSTCSGRSRSLPFSRESSEMFDRPSINLGRIAAAMRSTRSRTRARWRSTSVTYPDRILRKFSRMSGRCPASSDSHVHSSAGQGRAHRSVRARAARCRRALDARDGDHERRARWRLGRGGVSGRRDPGGGVRPRRRGPPRPDGWVSVASLARYRRALGDFVRSLPIWLEQADGGGRPDRASAVGGDLAAGLRAVEGGLP